MGLIITTVINKITLWFCGQTRKNEQITLEIQKNVDENQIEFDSFSSDDYVIFGSELISILCD